MRSLRGVLPWALGAASYIIEAGIAENIAHLGGLVDDVQLTLFDGPFGSNIPSPRETAEIQAAARGLGVTISAHMPASIDLGSPDASVRAESAELFRRTVGAIEPMEPSVYVLHASVTPVAPQLVSEWIEREAAELSRLIGMLDSPRQIAIENVEPSFSVERGLIAELDTSVCVDVGHLVMHGLDVEPFAAEWAHRCTAVHVHGSKPGGPDHRSLAEMDPRELADVFAIFERIGFSGVMTMEVFGMDDFTSSMDAVHKILILD